MDSSKFKKVREAVWEMPKEEFNAFGSKFGMRVPAKVFATERLFRQIEGDCFQQLKNTATLPGIQKFAIGESDMHFGYGFPIGGVAAFDGESGGIVSPGGVGFDINCGVRLIRTNLRAEEVKPKLKQLIDILVEMVPAGVGEKGKIRLNRQQLEELLKKGARWAVENGYGWKSDLERIEENGEMKEANPAKVSPKAMERGLPQSGTLGSGNHFLEIQRVDKIFDEKTAKVFGLFEGQAVIMLHSGSRGCGHQIATDYIDVMMNAMKKYGITVPDRQLACAPIGSKEGQDYLQAMYCGVNYAFANRQAMTHWIREGFEKVFSRKAEDLGMETVYDICHNVAKFEEHEVDGKTKNLLVHRKGATRAMPAGRKENPKAYMETGHPAIIPGSMGTPSYVLVGTETGLKEAFGSVCHGAGRVMSRTSATKGKRGEDVKRELEARGQVVRGVSWSGLAEEAPEAYKDIDEVVKSVELAGIGKIVAKMAPMGVMKG
jgi:tRNA-splicing ligase RtcB